VQAKEKRMKKTIRKLALGRETLRSLDESRLSGAGAAVDFTGSANGLSCVGHTCASCATCFVTCYVTCKCP
jgi:hypothetical protein